MNKEKYNSDNKSIIKQEKKQITIRLNKDTIDYFKIQADKTGISYQNLINMYLTDCAVHEKELIYTIK